MRLRLIRKLAQSIDGVDLSRYAAGDLIEVPRYEAELLIAERWAETVTEQTTPVPVSATGRARRQLIGPVARVSEAADAPSRTLHTAERLCEIRRQMELKSLGPQEQRRTEDRIREELRDSRARTFHGRFGHR